MEKMPLKTLSVKDACPKIKLKEFDQKAKTILKVPENLLIENASRGIMEVLIDQGIKHKSVSIFAGRGNNGADSLALARHLFNRGAYLTIFLVLNNKPPNREVEFQLAILKKMIDSSAIRILNSQEDFKGVKEGLGRSDLVVDGIWGIGFKPPLDSFHKRLLSIINCASGNILSVDIPSGLCADEGTVDQQAVKARITVTFVAPKLGFFLGCGPKHTGKIFVKDIGLSRAALEGL